jgi:aminoglycoside phosphotransferase (APT) family kinase protein
VTSDERVRHLATGVAAVTGADRATVDGRAMGGLSQETWLVTLERGGVTRPGVLRLPTAASGGRSIATQRRALEVSHAHGLPVPALLATGDSDANPFGRPFLVMERAAGEIPAGWEALSHGRRHRVGLDAMRVLADLHAVPLEAAVASGLRQPTTSAPADELTFYRRRFAQLGISPHGTVEVAFRWLEAHRPSGDERVLVHNDFRMGNFVLDGDRVSAVLDWELAAIGNPLADLTWCFIAVWAVVDVDLPAMFAAYAEASGRRIDPLESRWYTALGYLRLLYYGLSAGASFLAGETNDLRQAALRLQAPMRIDRLLGVVAGEAVA